MLRLNEFLPTFKWSELTDGEKQLILLFLLDYTVNVKVIKSKIGHKRYTEWLWYGVIVNHRGSEDLLTLNDEIRKPLIKMLKDEAVELPDDEFEEPIHFRKLRTQDGRKHCTILVSEDEESAIFDIGGVDTDFARSVALAVEGFLDDYKTGVQIDVEGFLKEKAERGKTGKRSFYLMPEKIEELELFSKEHGFPVDDALFIAISRYIKKEKATK